MKHLVLKLGFVDRLEYVRESAFRTPPTFSPFALFGSLGGEEVMARPSRESLNELFYTLAQWNACLAELPPPAP